MRLPELRQISGCLILFSLSFPSIDEAQSPTRGDTIVRNAGTPRFATTAQLREDISIGAENMGNQYLLENVIAILPARDGTIWVLDGSGPTLAGTSLRRYDAKGKFLTRISHH